MAPNEMHHRNVNVKHCDSSQQHFEEPVKYRKEITYALYETDTEHYETVIDANGNKMIVAQQEEEVTASAPQKQKYVYVWRNIAAMIALHLAALYGFYLTPYAKVPTIIWAYVCLVAGTMGVQAGAHRLWAHRTYKANFGVRLVLAWWHILSLQNDIYEWCRDHRAHHKFADTDADPHNSSKGFFFSHVGWLLVKKHPDVIRRGATLDLSDLLKDPIVRFQQKYYIPLVILLWGMVPTFVPVLLWGEDLFIAGFLCVAARYVVALNITWCVNSWAHMFGYRAYDTRLHAVEASMRHLLLGEGFHNYHHAFPWDYSASELGPIDVFNPCTALIDLFHWAGWAWDLKKVSPAMIDAKKKKTGDPAFYHKQRTALWEWSTGLATALAPLGLMIYLNLGKLW